MSIINFINNQLILNPFPYLTDLCNNFDIFSLLVYEEMSITLKHVWATGR